MIIVGSTALKHFGMNRNEPKDVDVWVTEDETYSVCRGYDIHVLPNEVLDLIPHSSGGHAIPDAVYTIKCSHLAWDIKWEKTKNDILWLKANGCKLLPKLYRELKKHWEGVHGDKSFLSLNKCKEDFFQDGVKYVYDHDYLHELVAFPATPMYTHCLKDGEDVLIDKDKFDCMSTEMQLRMFKEEVTVIAIERWLLHKNDISWFEAYGLALKKTITNLTKNWACDFIISNLDYFVKPEYEYFKHALETLKIGDSDMSDIKDVFEQFIEENKIESSLSYFVYCLTDGDLWDLEVEGMDWREVDDFINAKLDEKGYKHLKQSGGGEGGAEYCYGVFEFDGKIYRAEYSYYSYNGFEYDYIVDTLKEVQPKTRTITVYE